jgi:hypothetical protein
LIGKLGEYLSQVLWVKTPHNGMETFSKMEHQQGLKIADIQRFIVRVFAVASW